MKNTISLFILLSLFFVTSCEQEQIEIMKPNIIFENPNNSNFLIGETISISISINHTEVLDKVKYYEIFNCSDDNYNFLNLFEWENIYETSWSYEKELETESFPEELTCTYTIEIEATDLNNQMSSSTMVLEINNSQNLE